MAEAFDVNAYLTCDCAQVENQTCDKCAVRGHIAALARELEEARTQRGAFPEEHAYMALLRLPITGTLRASGEMQAAMAACVHWLAVYLNQDRQHVQEYYEDRVGAESNGLSRAPEEQ